MPNKISNDQAAVLSAIKKLEASLKTEIRKGDNALRAEMKSGNKAIRQEMLKIEERVEGVEGAQRGFNAGQAEMNKKIDNLQNDLDGFMGKVEALEQENSLGVKQYRDHEDRISKLESSVRPA